MACYYRATDPVYGHSDDSDGFVDVYPDYDFTVLARWAWAASRAVDYLVTLPNVARNQIGIAGHSRNGKQALLAAAFDERIAAVVASSGLQGESLPYRYTSDPYMVESIQFVTTTDPHWFHPRLRFFTGREHKLPVDQNSLMALVAPRGLMIYASYQESNANAFALEQAYRSVRDVYRFCSHEERVWLQLREGDHPTETGDVENFIDFFDTVFGRASHPRSESWIAGFDFETWKRNSGKPIDPVAFPARKPGAYLSDLASEGSTFASEWGRRRSELRARLQAFLGPPPPLLASPLSRSLRENSPSSPQSRGIGFWPTATGLRVAAASGPGRHGLLGLFVRTGPSGRRVLSARCRRQATPGQISRRGLAPCLLARSRLVIEAPLESESRESLPGSEAQLRFAGPARIHRRRLRSNRFRQPRR
jgi:hypothetical protein